MNQVLLNLLSNAVKFTPAGGTVSVRLKQLPGTVKGSELYEIRIKDNGIGMSPEFVKKIFSPFERERTSTVSRTQGTGLGMAITKNIVDMMGGTIEVQTEQGKGTEFIVRLPFRIQSEQHHTEKIAELEGLKALVVDDDFNTCDSVTKMLVKVGMRSEWTLSGKEAVLRARQSMELGDAFHAYIIDWRLPDMNGILCETSVCVRYPRDFVDCYRSKSGQAGGLHSSKSKYEFQRQMYTACGRQRTEQ